MSTDQPLSKNLQDHYKAIEEEFEVASKSTSDEVIENTRNKLIQILPDALEELVAILRVGDKDDAVRLQAIKFVFEYALGRPATASTKDDDVNKIIDSLLASPTK